jgi:cytoskeletal protein RodZ
MTLGDLSEKTKIRKEFLDAIEKEQWRALPEFSVVTGFVKSMADAVSLNRDQAVALLRRDYPPSEKNTGLVTPKPDIPKEFRWSPRLTFLAGVGVIVLGIAGYLVLQYISFTRPPEVVVEAPQENEVVLTSELEVVGKTDPSTTVIVNTQPALVDENGEFHTIIEINESITKIEVKAVSRAGKETVVTRTIKPEIQ